MNETFDSDIGIEIIGNIDEGGCVRLHVDHEYMYINKQDAQKIIAHLQKVFELDKG